MPTDSIEETQQRNTLSWLVIGLVSAFWFLEALLYVLINDGGSVIQRMVDFNINAVATRVLVLCFFMIFGSHVHYVARKRRQLDEALKLSEKKQASIIEDMEDGYIETDENGKISFFNKAFQAICGLPADRIIGGEIFSVFDRTNRQKLKTAFENTVSSNEPTKDVELTIIREGGGMAYLDVTVTPTFSSERTVNGFRGLFRDITKRVMAEKLEKEKISAELASRSKSEFLANMSHEIRTPLNAVIGLAELTLDTELTNEQRDNLDVVLSAAHSLLSLINDMLDFSKIEAGKLELETIEFDLRDFLGESLKIMAVKANEKHIELAYRVHPDIPEILYGDPVRFRQIVLNLVGNAVKFTDDGEVIITVDINRQDGDFVELHFAVRDTGVGIPPEKQQIIFSPFDQADGSTTRRFGGTGLGLAVSSQLVSLMGGRIWVDSVINQGSTFHFVIPFTALLKEKKEHALALDYELAGIRMLVVDDNASVLGIIKEMVESWRMFALTTDSVETAMKIVAKRSRTGIGFDIVLIDANMEGGAGLKLLQWLKDADRTSKVILMLNSSRERVGLDKEALGFAGSVVKPIRPSDLLDAVIASLGYVTDQIDAMAVKRSRKASHNTRTLSILVAEDTPFNQKYIGHLLDHWGYTAEIVNNGKAAVDALQKGAYDMVLMDIQMPGMDGFEATAAIRKMEADAGGHIPIIAMTAHAMKGDRDRCLESGMDAYVSKPISQDLLYETIASLAPASSVIEHAPEEGSDDDTTDMRSLLASLSGDSEFLSDLIGLFLDDYPKLSEDISRAISDNNSDIVRQSAHALKGMVGSFQAEAVRRQLEDLETMGSSGDLAGAGNLFEDIGRGIDGLVVRLNEVLEKLRQETTATVR